MVMGVTIIFRIAWASSRRYLASIRIAISVPIYVSAHLFLQIPDWPQLEFYTFNLQQMVMTVFWIAWASSRRYLTSILTAILLLIYVSAHPFPQNPDEPRFEFYETNYDISAATDRYDCLFNRLSFLHETS